MNCPDCESDAVSRELGNEELSPTMSIASAIAQAEEGDTVQLVSHCWTCGWHEERDIAVTDVRVEPGDDEDVEREIIKHEVNEELEQIESIQFLKGALAEVRRARRLEPRSDDG